MGKARTLASVSLTRYFIAGRGFAGLACAFTFAMAVTGAHAGTVAITSPNGGEEWGAGTTQSVTWTGTDLTGDAHIYLYDDGQYVAYLGTAPAWAEFLEWYVCPGVGAGTAFTVSISVQDTDGFWLSDNSDGVFTITGDVTRPQFSIDYPLGGESFAAGSQLDITWTSADPQGMVTIELYRGWQSYQWLGQVPMSDGQFSFTLCQYLEDAADWSIQLSWWDDCGVYLSSRSGDFSTYGGSPQTRPSITLTSLNGGEVLQAGSSYEITWDAQNAEGWLSISLYKDNAWYGYLGGTEASAGHFTWNVCTGMDNGNDYWLMLSASDSCGAYVGDSSEGRFSVTGAVPQPAPTLQLTSPVAEASWQEGTVQTITWTSTNPSGTVYAMLYRDGAYLSYLGSAPMGGGSLDWFVCSPQGAGEGYSVQIYAYDDCGRYVPTVASGAFSITPGAFTPIQLTSPNGGETWTGGSTQTVTWSTDNPTGTVYVYLVKAGGWSQYLGGAPASAGLLQYDVCGFLRAGSDYRIRLDHHSSCGLNSDTSDADFTIGGTATLAVQSPNGGETLEAGTTVPITWTATGAPPETYAYVNLYKAGAYHSWIGAVPASAGTLNWNICPFIGDGADYTVEISMYGCASLVDVSDLPFSITGSGPPASLSLISPNGGEFFTAGAPATIAWATDGLYGSLQINLLKGNNLVETIAWPYPEDGSYEWYICEYLGDGGYRIEIIGWDQCGRQLVDTSDFEFTVSGSSTRPSFSITAPSGGEAFLAGTELTVTWNATNPTGYVDVYIEAPELGMQWIGSAWMSDGTWTGMLDSWLGYGTEYAIRLSWCECGICVEDTSNATFTVFQPVRADFNTDGKVDHLDYELFEDCASGPGIPYTNPPAGCAFWPDYEGVSPADLDRDGDVDQADFAAVQRCYSGDMLAMDASCAD